MNNSRLIKNVEQLNQLLEQQKYICNQSICLTLFLSITMEKPILIEGPPGVGKTILADALAKALSIELVRLQCYEGLDDSKAIYEWKYAKQLLYTQVLKDHLNDVLKDTSHLDTAVEKIRGLDDLFFADFFLEPRPLLKAIQHKEGCVLLIDEIDKADEEFEAMLLEFLADYQLTLPEIGTIFAKKKPITILTSNSTRELSDALKRRCLYLYIDFPTLDLEQKIIKEHLPNVSQVLIKKIAIFVQTIRAMDLRKAPAISETIDWAKTLLILQQDSIDSEFVFNTLNILIKHQDDLDLIKPKIEEILQEVN